MGWRGTLRSIEAASRRAAKNAERQAKAQQKLAEIESAANAVNAFNEYIEKITKLHVTQPTQVNWQTHLAAPEPVEPEKTSPREAIAKSNIERYTPSFLTKLFKLENSKRQKLQHLLENAIADDDAEFSSSIQTYKKRHEEWLKLKTTAQKISNGDGEAFLSAIQQVNTFKDVTEIGYSITFRISENNGFYVDLNVGGKEVIPTEKYTQLQSGRLSVKQMPKGDFIELYQDYVCSCILRVAVEIFAILPLKAAVITALDEMINPQTGLLELQALVSAYIPRETIEKINLANVDPSRAMENFLHTMDFKKSRGFLPVTPVEHPQPCY